MVEDGEKMLKMYKEKPIRGDIKSHNDLITQVIFLDGARAAEDVSAKEKHAHSFVIQANSQNMVHQRVDSSATAGA